MTTTALTASKARQYARSLVSWGYYGVKIVETFPEGKVRIEMTNACGMHRAVEDVNDFIEMREEAAR